MKNYIKVIFITLFSTILFYILFCIKYKKKCPKDYKILATGCSSNHFHLLLLMLYRIYITESKTCLVVWNLGLSLNEKSILANAEEYISKRKSDLYIYNYIFNYSNYPPHFNIENNAGVYAWKPFVIYESYIKYKRSILWLDAGCFIKNKLDYEFLQIKKKKIWSISQGSSIKKYTHCFLMKLLETSNDIANSSMCAGGVIGLYYPSQIVLSIMNLWKACALIKQCISPNGANTKNHRNDQSVISILLYQYNLGCNNEMPHNFETHFDGKYSTYNDKNYVNYLVKIKYK